jgi:hypothetical protein
MHHSSSKSHVQGPHCAATSTHTALDKHVLNVPPCPASQVRFMVRRPMVVDGSTNDDVEEDDLDLVEGAGAATARAQTTGAAGDAGEQADAPADKKKSVRLAADGELRISHLLYGVTWCCDRNICSSLSGPLMRLLTSVLSLQDVVTHTLAARPHTHSRVCTSCR